MTRSPRGAAAVGRIVAAAAVVLLVVAPIGARASGWRWVRVVSPSMEPAIAVGSVVLVRPVTGDEVGPGDVIAFRDPTEPSRHVLHRVKRRFGEKPDVVLETQGDASPSPDSYPVPEGLVFGRLAGAAPPAAMIRASSLALAAAALVALARDEASRRRSRQDAEADRLEGVGVGGSARTAHRLSGR